MSPHAWLTLLLVVATPVVVLLVLFLSRDIDEPRNQDRAEDEDDAGEDGSSMPGKVPLAA